jgi:hypothetical protein
VPEMHPFRKWFRRRGSCVTPKSDPSRGPRHQARPLGTHDGREIKGCAFTGKDAVFKFKIHLGPHEGDNRETEGCIAYSGVLDEAAQSTDEKTMSIPFVA